MSIRSQNRRASTATELALILTLIGCGCVIAYTQLGKQTQRTFARLQLSDSDGKQPWNAFSDGESLALKNIPDSRQAAQSDPGAPIAVTLVCSIAGIFVIAISLVSMTRRTRSKPKDQISEESVPPSPLVSELPQALFEKRQDLLRVLAKTQVESPSQGPTVRLVMSSKLECVLPKAPIAEIKQRMKAQCLRHLLVCDGNGKLVGVVSDRDVIAKQGTTAAQIMSSAPMTISADTQLIPAVTVLINRHFSSLPVVDGDKLVGILTTTDILLSMQALLLIQQRRAH